MGSNPLMCPRFNSNTWHHIWVEFVVVSLLCSERFFSWYTSFTLSSKISKFQLDLDYCLAFYHEPLAQVIAQALPAFDVKFSFTLHCLQCCLSFSSPCTHLEFFTLTFKSLVAIETILSCSESFCSKQHM